MSAVMSLSWALMQYPVGRLWIDRQRGFKPILIFSEACGIPLMLILMTQTRLEFFLIAQVIFALTAATWVPVIATYLSRSVADAERAHVFGRIAAFRGIIAFPAPTIGGWLYAWGGLRAPLAANLIGILVVITLFFFFVREPAQAHDK
jgi:MFS family permease